MDQNYSMPQTAYSKKLIYSMPQTAYSKNLIRNSKKLIEKTNRT